MTRKVLTGFFVFSFFALLLLSTTTLAVDTENTNYLNRTVQGLDTQFWGTPGQSATYDLNKSFDGIIDTAGGDLGWLPKNTNNKNQVITTLNDNESHEIGYMTIYMHTDYECTSYSIEHSSTYGYNDTGAWTLVGNYTRTANSDPLVFNASFTQTSVRRLRYACYAGEAGLQQWAALELEAYYNASAAPAAGQIEWVYPTQSSIISPQGVDDLIWLNLTFSEQIENITVSPAFFFQYHSGNSSFASFTNITGFPSGVFGVNATSTNTSDFAYINFTIDVDPPSIIQTITNFSTFFTQYQTIVGQANFSDNAGLDRFELFLNSTLVRNQSLSNATFYVFNFSSNVSSFGPGVFNYTAKLFDASGSAPLEQYTTIYFADVNIAVDPVVLSGENVSYLINISTHPDFFSNYSVIFDYNFTNFTLANNSFPGVNTYEYSRFAPNTTANVTTIDWRAHFGCLHEEANTNYQTQTAANINLDQCGVYSHVALNMSLRDDDTEALILGDTNGYFELTYGAGLIKAYNFSWINSSNPQVCMNPQQTNISVYGQMEYDAPSYDTKLYYLSGAYFTNTTQDLDLYLTNSSSSVQITVKDQLDVVQPNVFVHVLLYDVGTDSYKTIEVLETDTNGQVYAELVLDTKFYSFQVVKNMEVALLTLPSIISITSVSLILEEGSDFFDTYDSLINYQGALTFTNSSLTFAFDYSDPSLEVDQSCLKLERIVNGARTLLNTSCLTTQSGTILSTINEPVSSNSYRATAYVIIDGSELLIENLQKDFDLSYKEWGNNGVFLSFFVILAITLFGLWNPIAALVMNTAAVIALNYLGLLHLGGGVIGAYLVLIIIAILRIKKK